MQALLQQTMKQQEALHALQLRMEAIEARQHRTWAQFMWRGRQEPSMHCTLPDGGCLAREHETAEHVPSEGSEGEDLVQKKTIYQFMGLESMMEFVESVNDCAESVLEVIHRWIDSSE